MQFEEFLDAYGRKTGSVKLVEAVRSAYRACTEASLMFDDNDKLGGNDRVAEYKRKLAELKVKYPHLPESVLREKLWENELTPDELVRTLNPHRSFGTKTVTNSNTDFYYNEDDRALQAAEQANEFDPVDWED